MATVRLDNVSKTYPGDVRAVESVSLEIADGEFLVLVGPSGCGKTTTLRMVAGLETITEGAIEIGGRVVNTIHPKDRDIAMVFQDYALYPHMTVRRNLSFGLKLRKTPKDEIVRRVGETAKLLGIEMLLERKPGALSGGQQQRVALGRAIVRHPKVYLFDEPLSNLDAKLRVQMRSELKSLHARLATTAIYVTHDQEEAMTLGDRLVVMANGEVQQIGRPLDVYRAPANRFVAGFLGSPAMNFLDGTLDAGVFSSAGFTLPAGTNGASGDVTIGVRPEHLRPVSDGPLELTVDVVEPLGDRTDVYAHTAAGNRLIARVASEVDVAAGASIRFTVDESAVHVFERGEFGRAIK